MPTSTGPVLRSRLKTVQFGAEPIEAIKNIRFENVRILAPGKAAISITSDTASAAPGRPPVTP